MSTPDLDKHDVLVSDFDFPCKIPRVSKWVLPRTFLDGPVDKVHFDQRIAQGLDDCAVKVRGAIEHQNVGEALADWSAFHEECFAEASCHCDGEHRTLGSKYFGRCQVEAPKAVQLALPRCKTGRPGDYQPPFASTLARQLVKQTRRLQRLWHIMAHRDGPILDDAVALWQAIVRATGFGKSFPRWCIANLGWYPLQFPTVEGVSEMYQFVKQYTDEVTRKAWSMRREAFSQELEESCARRGGSLPCRLVKEETQPLVTEMQIRHQLSLMPQGWMPGGKAWVKISNADVFCVGDTLETEAIEARVLEKVPGAVRLDRLVSRREAVELTCTKVEVNPEKWTAHFVGAWETYGGVIRTMSPLTRCSDTLIWCPNCLDSSSSLSLVPYCMKPFED